MMGKGRRWFNFLSATLILRPITPPASSQRANAIGRVILKTIRILELV